MSDEDLHTQIALLSQQLKHLAEQMQKMEDDQNEELERIRSDVREIKAQANKWKGAIGVVLGASGFLIAILVLLDKVGGLFKSSQ